LRNYVLKSLLHIATRTPRDAAVFLVHEATHGLEEDPVHDLRGTFVGRQRRPGKRLLDWVGTGGGVGGV
jgi:hypothetical protein